MWNLEATVYDSPPNMYVRWANPTRRFSHKEGLIIVLTTGTYPSAAYQTRQAIMTFGEVVAEDMKSEDQKWIIPGFNEWVLNLDRLRHVFPALGGLPWLKGIIAVKPEVDVKRMQTRGTRKKFYRAEAKFYLYPELVGRQQVNNQTPDAIRSSLEAFKEDYPDPTRAAFLMMEFADTKVHGSIVESIREILKPYGIKALRADDRRYNDDLFPNVQTYMHGCGFGIAVFERIESDRSNPNVAQEVGYMTAIGKPICLLKDKNLTYLHSDLSGKIYEPFDIFSPLESIHPKLERWLEDKKLIVRVAVDKAS